MDFNKQQAVKHKKEANYDSIQNIDYIYQIITGRLMTCKPDQICSLYVVSACHFESVTELNCTDGKLAESWNLLMVALRLDSAAAGAQRIMHFSLYLWYF